MLALLVNNNTTLTLNACYNSGGVNTYPNLFSGGITVSNASVFGGLNNGSTTPAKRAARHPALARSHWKAARTPRPPTGRPALPTNGTYYACGATGSSTPTLSATLLGPIDVPAGQFGTLWLPQRGLFSCTLTGEGTLIVQPNYVRGQLGGDWTAFTGTIIFYPWPTRDPPVPLGQSTSRWVTRMPRCICKCITPLVT